MSERDEYRKLAIEHWHSLNENGDPVISIEQKREIMNLMSNTPNKDPEWHNFVRSQLISNMDEMLMLDQMGVKLNYDEEIDVNGRFDAKNFANNPDAYLAHLKNENPEIAHSMRWRNGQVVAMKPGGKEEYPIDKGGWPTIEDATDVAYDTAGAIATGAATAGSILSGSGAAFSPLVAGTVSAGVESIRQLMGMGVGIPQTTDMGQIGISGLTGAAPPLLGKLGSLASGPIKNYGPKIARTTANYMVPPKLTGFVANQMKRVSPKPPAPPMNMSKEPLLKYLAAEKAANAAPPVQSILPKAIKYGGIQGAANPWVTSYFQKPSSSVGGGVSPHYD